jgi:hypothetical protein
MIEWEMYPLLIKSFLSFTSATYFLSSFPFFFSFFGSSLLFLFLFFWCSHFPVPGVSTKKKLKMSKENSDEGIEIKKY